MKQIKLAAVALSVMVGFSVAARAATLSVSTDKSTYLVGELITVSVVGDSQGASDNAVNATLNYSSTLTDTLVTPTQLPLLSVVGLWSQNSLSSSDGSAEMFDQSRTGSSTVLNQLSASVVLTATGLGTVNLAWAGVDFFGLTSAPGTSFTVVSTPEPGTALLVGTGLALLAGIRRRRA